jgi:hypothetical protein
MYRFQLAYRFLDGSVMGFVQGDFSKEAAETACHRDIIKRCVLNNETFDRSRVIMSSKGLSKDEIRSIEHDWHIGRGQGILATRSDYKKRGII